MIRFGQTRSESETIKIIFAGVPPPLDYRLPDESGIVGQEQKTRKQAPPYTMSLGVKLSLTLDSNQQKIKLRLEPGQYEYMYGDRSKLKQTPPPTKNEIIKLCKQGYSYPDDDPIRLLRFERTLSGDKREDAGAKNAKLHLDALEKGYKRNSNVTTLPKLALGPNTKGKHTRISNSNEFYSHLKIIGDKEGKWNKLTWPKPNSKDYETNHHAGPHLGKPSDGYELWKKEHIYGVNQYPDKNRNGNEWVTNLNPPGQS